MSIEFTLMVTTTTYICKIKCFPSDHHLFAICPSPTCDSLSFIGLSSAVTTLKNNHCHSLPPRFSQCTQSLQVGRVLQGSAIDRQHPGTLVNRAFTCCYSAWDYSVDLRDEMEVKHPIPIKVKLQ